MRKTDIMEVLILRQHGIRAVKLLNGTVIADTSKEEKGVVHNVSKMSDKEFWAFLGY